MTKTLSALFTALLLVLTTGGAAHAGTTVKPVPGQDPKIDLVLDQRECGDGPPLPGQSYLGPTSFVVYKIVNQAKVKRTVNVRAYWGEPASNAVDTNGKPVNRAVTIPAGGTRYVNARWPNQWTLQFKVWRGALADRAPARLEFYSITSC